MPTLNLALKIVTKLVTHGHVAYFAGGWVRDFVMKCPSEDIDIATSASPEEIVDLFPSTLLVGIQFGVVIVMMEGHPFEVATFRQDVDYKDGRKPERIEPASPEMDAERRDFTINGMFYDPVAEQVHDYVGGRGDIQKGILRTIGDPYDRFFEDRLRMIRAVRFAARFNFKIDFETEQAIKENADSLFPAVAMERIWQELSKMSAYPRFDVALLMMHRLGLLGVIFPELAKVPLHEMEKRVAPLKGYPKEAPKSLFIQELLPGLSADEFIELGKYLKMANKDSEHLSFYLDYLPFSLDLPRYESAFFYAHPDSEIALEVFAARMKSIEANTFLKAHGEKKKGLGVHIERIKEKNPLLTSSDLFHEGIGSGRNMGILLKEGEKLAISQDIQDKKNLMDALKQTPLWSACTK